MPPLLLTKPNHSIPLTIDVELGNPKTDRKSSLPVKTFRVAKFKRPSILDHQKRSEDNQKLRSGCPPDYQYQYQIFL